MKLSEQWLREWADPAVDSAGLAEQLTMAGLEVDAVIPAAPALDNVVVGLVTELGPHPDADRLRLCQVDVGSKAPVQIVCGAKNVQRGGRYPVALVGARLPGDLRIKRSKIRGVESHGMLCSSVELGLSETAGGLLELDNSAKPGQSVVDLLLLDDTIIDLDLTPNRADCFSVVGVGRDIAALNQLPFNEPDIAAVPEVCDATVPIKLAANSACPVFAGRVIRNINPAARSPLWLVERLRRGGVRALHPVVDVTNYVMLELGQPMHAYDLALLDGEISARMAKPGEQLQLLDEQTITLTADMLVIANGDAPVALAGIMGGAKTAVSAKTTSIFLESAWFSPASIAGRARRYGLHTEASLRFERGVDFTGQLRAIERATQLLLEIVGGEPGPAVEMRNAEDLPRRESVQLRKSKLASVMGIALADSVVTDMLNRLGLSVSTTDAGWEVIPPANRFDIALEVDLVEEVIRLHGYDSIPEIPEHAQARLAAVSEQQVSMQRATETLINRGFQEAITYSFVDPEQQRRLLGEAAELELANPLSVDLSVMRRSLWVGLLQAVSLNRKRQQARVRLFESGLRFSLKDTEIKEENLIAGVAWGKVLPECWDGKTEATSIFNIKSDIEAVFALTGAAHEFTYQAADHPALSPGRSSRIERAGQPVGWIGELHPAMARDWNLQPAPVLFELAADLCLAADVPQYSPISRFPSVRRDLAVVVDADLPAQALVEAARHAAGYLLRDITVFDIFTGKGIENGLKSVALGLILQETSRTLTDTEIDSVISAVKGQLSDQFNASIRE